MIIATGEKLYSLNEVQELLHVCRATVCNYIRAGILTPTLVGKRRYINEKDLNAFLKRK